MDVSIIIPTKNAGERICYVLESIFTQDTDFTYEVICVDSGSKDKTLEYIKEYHVKLYTIPPAEFGHGKTRNYGASLGSGEFIIFLTQDAIPADKYWLQRMIEVMKIDCNIAGAFGIHYPYEDCNPIDSRNICLHFRGFGDDVNVFYLEDEDRYKKDEVYRHYLSFFSDNNSCLRRSVWEKYNYEDVDFAEDQLWAKKIIELGYKKAYTPFSAVYHSHNYKLSTYFKRYFDEYKGLYNVHKYKISDKFIFVIPKMLKHIFCDVKYVMSIKIKNKVYWIFYAIFRNISMYIAAYLAGNYEKYNEKTKKNLDKMFSLQYKQTRG